MTQKLHVKLWGRTPGRSPAYFEERLGLTAFLGGRSSIFIQNFEHARGVPARIKKTTHPPHIEIADPDGNRVFIGTFEELTEKLKKVSG